MTATIEPGAAERGERDRGSALVVAIGFVLLIGTIGAALAALVTSSVNNRATLEQVRNQQYAADGAVELAIAAQASAPSGECDDGAGSTTSTLNSFDIRVQSRNACSVVRTPAGLLLVQHNVEFTACSADAADCDGEAIIRASVNFSHDASGNVTDTAVQTWSVER